MLTLVHNLREARQIQTVNLPDHLLEPVLLSAFCVFKSQFSGDIPHLTQIVLVSWFSQTRLLLKQ